MSFNQYNATHKTWDHVGNITPNVEYSEPHRPHGEYLVADWLSVGRYDKYYEDYFVVSSGKIIAFDRAGRVVPAGMKVAFAAAGNVLTYTATDVQEGVVDLTTGVAVAAPVAYTAAAIATALISLGLLDAGQVAADFVSNPVGVAPYNYYHWAGGDGFNPSDYRLNNHNMQHRVAILCKYVVEMPLVPGDVANSDLAVVFAAGIQNIALVDWTDTLTVDGSFNTSTALSLTARYAAAVAAGDDVIALNLQVMNLSKSTPLTPVTLPAGFILERETLAEVVASSTLGDYWIDYDVGLIVVNDGGAGGAAVPVSLQTGVATFFAYDSIPTTVSSFACALGALTPGAFLVSDANSNFVEARSFGALDVEFAGFGVGVATDAQLAAMVQAGADRSDAIIGQVLDSELFPKDYLDRVRTAYPDLGTMDQMPGTASGGLRDQLTYAGGSNKMVRILLLK